MKKKIINKNAHKYRSNSSAYIIPVPEDVQKYTIFNRWGVRYRLKRLAENSKGHSPAASTKKVNLSALSARQALSSDLKEADVKRLPVKPINLMMRQAEIKSVLRALAKSVDLNIIVKNDLKGEINVDFKGIPWNQAFTGLLHTYGLSYAWEGNVIRVMTIEDFDQDLKQKVSMRDMQWVEPLLQPVLINIDYADAKKLSETLQDFLTKDKDGKPRGSVKVDEHSYSLVISAMQNDLMKMLPIIEQIDKPTAQILIKANIVETTKGVARNLGIMWGGMYKGNIGGTDHYITPGGTSGTTSPFGTVDSSGIYTPGYTPTAGGSTGIAGQGFATNFGVASLTSAASGSLGLIIGTLGGNLLEMQLQALQADNKLNILSSPSITTLDNQKAFTENGDRVPFVTNTMSGGTITQTTQFEDVVLRLEITPHVIDGKNLKMTILVKKDEVDLTRKSSLGDPYIVKKQTQTTLIVNDGETIVISGLTKQLKTETETGWPWLKDITGLGWLFKTESKSDSMEEVLIFITPHILQVADSRPNAASVEEDKGLKGDEKK